MVLTNMRVQGLVNLAFMARGIDAQTIASVRQFQALYNLYERDPARMVQAGVFQRVVREC